MVKHVVSFCYFLIIIISIHADHINIIIQPSRVVAAKGGSINISITAEGPGKENFGYHWRRRDNIPLSNTASGTKTQNLTITSVTFSDSGAYNCSVMNQWGRRVDSDYTTITVLSKYSYMVAKAHIASY